MVRLYQKLLQDVIEVRCNDSHIASNIFKSQLEHIQNIMKDKTKIKRSNMENRIAKKLIWNELMVEMKHVQKLGVETAVLLSYFLAVFHKETPDDLYEASRFTITPQRIKSDCRFSLAKQNSLCCKLHGMGLISWKDTYNPFIRTYQLHGTEIENMLD